MSKQHYQLWLEAALRQEAPLPTWVVAILVLATICAFGIAGQLDYEAERGFECNNQGLYYDSKADACTPHPISK